MQNAKIHDDVKSCKPKRTHTADDAAAGGTNPLIKHPPVTNISATTLHLPDAKNCTNHRCPASRHTMVKPTNSTNNTATFIGNAHHAGVMLPKKHCIAIATAK